MAGPLNTLLDLADLTTTILPSLPSTSTSDVQPPRPPNSWILYRAWKVKNLPPCAPGEARRSQGEISAIVSEMWRNENANIRAYFERLADEAKADHKEKYPGYRYKPQKKDDTKAKGKTTRKSKGKGRKKDSRPSRGVSREAESSTSHNQQRPGHPYPTTSRPLRDPYDRIGPSPPLSAASTPSSSSSPLPPVSFPALSNTLHPDSVVAGLATPSIIPSTPFSHLETETDPFHISSSVFDYYTPESLDDIPQWQPANQVVAPAPSTVLEWEPSSGSQSNVRFYFDCFVPMPKDIYISKGPLF